MNNSFPRGSRPLRSRPTGFGLAAFAALAFVTAATSGQAQDAAALVDKLVQKGILSSQEGADVRADMQKEFSQSPAGKINLSNSVTQLQLYGDLRLRYQYNDTQPQHGDSAVIANEQSRLRYRLRLNADVQLGPNFFGGIQLQSGQTSDSGNQTYSSAFNNDSIYISRAFAGFQNDWLKVIVGKQANPFYTTDLVWDPDINPAGLTETVAFHKMPLFGGSDGPTGDDKLTIAPHVNPWEITLVAGQFIFGDNSSFASLKTNSNDPWIFDQQLIVKYKFNKDTSVTFAPGFLSETSAHITGALNTLPFTDEGAIVLDNNTITTTVAQVDVVSVKYSATGVPTKSVTPTTVTTTGSTAVAPVVASGAAQPTNTKSTANAVANGGPIVTVGKATGLPTDPSKAGQTFTTTVTNSTATATKTTTNTLPAVSAESAGLHILTAPGDISFSLGGIKSKLYWDVAYNVSGQDRFNNVYQLKNYGSESYRGRDSLAWLVGLQFGETKKKGDWQVYANFRQVGIASVDPNLNDSDFAQSSLNSQGFKMGIVYAVTDFVILNATGYVTWALDSNLSGGRATSVGGIAPYGTTNELQLDVNIKF